MMTLLWEDHLPQNKTKINFFQNNIKIGSITLSPQSGNTYFVEDAHFERMASPSKKEIAWEMFCREIQEKNLSLLLSCRSAQNFFGTHPEYSCLISSTTKTKPGF